MTKNIIFLKNIINMRINERSQFGDSYSRGFVDGLKEALSLIECLDSVDNDVKLRKRMDILQHQIDSLESRLQDVEK